MYYPDLSEYSYGRFDEKLKTQYSLDDETVFLNVGWLDNEHEFETTDPDPLLLQKMFDRFQEEGNMMRGYHNCPFCMDERFVDPNYFMVFTEFGDKRRWMGSMEIFVRHGNVVYIAPNLVFHYVEKHSYRPPQAFCDALLSL